MTEKQILEVRNSLGLSQPQLAQLLGVHPLTVSKWERGISAPNAHQIAMLESFRKARATSKTIGDEAATLLVTAGVALAVFALLEAAFGRRK